MSSDQTWIKLLSSLHRNTRSTRHWPTSVTRPVTWSPRCRPSCCHVLSRWPRLMLYVKCKTEHYVVLVASAYQKYTIADGNCSTKSKNKWFFGCVWLSNYNEYSSAYLSSLLLSSFTSVSRNHGFTYSTIVGNNDSTAITINSVLLEYGACKWSSGRQEL